MLTFYLVCVSFVSILGLNFPLTNISDGKIRGKFWKSRHNRTFSAFTGIPYAKPPVGNLRFKAPVPSSPWTGTFNATETHVECIQRDVFARQTRIYGEEDCLYLNVYTPKVDSFERDLLPVMVYIHEGAYLSGSGNSQWHAPDILLDKDIVLVIMNYRLGPLGFLSTGDEVVPGNNGLKDQNLAMRWVQKNVRSFGGNPEKITLTGYSAGASSVHYHMLSPLSKGLFQRAIILGGNALCPWALAEKNDILTTTKKTAQALDCPTEPSKSMIDCLRKIDARTIIDQDKILMKWDYDPMMPFTPTIESDVEGAFLTDHPANLMRAGKSMDVPVLTGFNKDEGALKVAGYKSPGLLDEFTENFDKLAPLSLKFGTTKNNTDRMTESIREFYFGDRRINESIRDIINLYTDSWILRGQDQFITLFRRYYTQPVYFSLFAYRGSISLTSVFQGGTEDYGVCHGDNLIYLFPIGSTIQPGWTPTESDEYIGNVYLSLLTSFVISKNATPHISDTISFNWNPYTEKNGEYLEISAPNHIGMKNKVFQKRIEFWRNLEKL